MHTLPEQIRSSYAALMSGDPERAADHCADDVTCHIGGAHPFSGEYRGVTQIAGVVRQMTEVAGPESFTVTSLMSDDDNGQVLIEGVAQHGTFVRHVINRLRYDQGRLAEVWIKPLDQRAEDDFWIGRVPQQRAGGTTPGDAD